MNYLLVIIYTSVCLVSLFLLTILINYQRDKPLDRQSLTDFIQIDLAMFTAAYIAYPSVVIFIREIVGPFHSEVIVEIVLFVMLLSYNFMLGCGAVLQVTNVLRTFFPSMANNWKEDIAFKLVRVVTSLVALSTSMVVCHFKGGVCFKGPFYMYFFQDQIKVVPFKGTMASFMPPIIFFSIIVLCQCAIEVKRFLLNRAEDRIDNMAIEAQRQIIEAFQRMSAASTFVHDAKSNRRRAWEEPAKIDMEQSLIYIIGRPVELVPSTAYKRKLYKNKASRDHAFKMARHFTLLGVAVGLLLFANVTLTNIDSIRPHGPLLAFYVAFGIIAPLTIIVNYQKLRIFAKDFIKLKITRWAEK